ncbi:site-specific DNA-methyltransferase [Lactobacillus amylovorus subsp. animalium]|uniref:DNA methyltransferase n=1 Tax=Lactobacillus amylovorus TaxID=1604 RepID=UPI0010AD51AA|nr:DNA methyltransferase [Lactobacillus amylovorus]MDB6248845.1 DNA methyltransferase [Lactobacillus amylovorus]TJY06648.1 site-specific DNA-methyltransferase [Lactobacillus amylovorus]
MAAIDDLIDQIEDINLRKRISQEVNRIRYNKKLGLVFEDHMTEATPLYGVKVKKGSKVALKDGKISDIYFVINIKNEIALCQNVRNQKQIETDVNNLITVAEFGDPIFPYLKTIDEVKNAPNSDLWHELIEADNYHALQLLDYLYAKKVDVIYIDPPYNSRAKDWKYNNDYVDKNDLYKHSKWLSFMKKRLVLAKKLLKPTGSVLIVTIDEKEYLRLGLLLEELFPEAHIQMITTVINPSGTGRTNEFSRVDEYIFFVMIGNIQIAKTSDDMLFSENKKKSSRIKGGLSWESFLRSGQSNIRKKETKLCYPILIDEKTLKVIDCLPPLKGENPATPKYINGHRAIYPIKKDGKLGIWRLVSSSFKDLLDKGYAYVSSYDSKNDRYALKYLLSGTIKRIENGEIHVKMGKEGHVISDDKYVPYTMPKTVWNKSTHNAGKLGSDVLNKVIGEKRFDYPKSVYAVEDTINFFVADNPHALILDFFAGSGTTLHAVNLLNRRDGGKRRCIMVTNNEVSYDEAKMLSQEGYKPGDKEWEKLGIAQYVTWPRTVCSILGKNIRGNEIKGRYVDDNIPMSQGFKANAIFFKLGFLDKNSVALGQQFKKLLSILWMKAGGIGECPSIVENSVLPKYMILPKNKFAILLNERNYREFMDKVNTDSRIKTVFIVTNSDDAYHEMIANLEDKQTYQLYKDYLDNFRINIRG